MKRLLATTALLAALSLPAHADVVLGGQTWTGAGAETLTLSAVVPGGNQPQNIQCVICGDNQPQQQFTFGYNDYKNQGSLSTALEFSTNIPGGANPGFNTIGLGYDGSFLRNYLIANGDTSLNFTIGIDINDNNTPQILNSFYLLNLTTHTVLAAFNPAVGVPVLSQNNGTGFPDYTLSGFNISVGGAGGDIHAGDQLIFFSNMSNLSDGPDSFFIQPSVAAVPGPIAGAGLPGLVTACFGLWAFAKRRRALHT